MLESPEVSGRTPTASPVAAGAGDQAAGGARRRRRPARARSRSRSGPPAWSSPRCRSTRPIPRRACTPSATPCPGAWHAMGVMLSAAGSLRWLRDARRRRGATRRSCARPRRWAPGAEGLTFLPYLAGERTPHADPRRARRVRRALAPPRPRRARAGGARGRGLRAARLVRARGRARRAPEVGPRLGRRRAQRAVAADRRLGARAARSSASPSRRAPRTARRCSAALRAACCADVEEAVGAASVPTARWSRSRGGSSLPRAGRALPGALSGATRHAAEATTLPEAMAQDCGTGPAAAATATSCRRSATRRSSSSSGSRPSRACASGPSSSPTTRRARSRTASRAR